MLRHEVVERVVVLPERDEPDAAELGCRKT
jgi:hypothetical protein